MTYYMCCTCGGLTGIFQLSLITLGFLPVVSAAECGPFPDVTFHVFSDFIQSQFASHVSLATVLTVLFTMTSNTDLLNLHARQQHPKVAGEVSQITSGWIKALARALKDKLGDSADSLLQRSDSSEDVTNPLAIKLDGLSKILNLHPYSEQGRFLGKLKPVSDHTIEPIHVICPISMECETASCQSRAILKLTRDRDTPHATLVKGTKIYDNVPVLAGQCTKEQSCFD
jgi:hypothetical protein